MYHGLPAIFLSWFLLACQYCRGDWFRKKLLSAYFWPKTHLLFFFRSSEFIFPRCIFKNLLRMRHPWRHVLEITMKLSPNGHRLLPAERAGFVVLSEQKIKEWKGSLKTAEKTADQIAQLRGNRVFFPLLFPNKLFFFNLIAHFRVAARLSFKASPGAQPFKWKWVAYAYANQTLSFTFQ